MRIGVNTRLLVKGKMDGIAWYAYETLRRMVKEHPEHEFVCFFDRPYPDEFVFGPNVRPVVLHPQARHPLLWHFFFEHSLKKALKREKIDVFFSPDGFLCLHTDVPSVSIIHDVNFEHFPEYLRFSHRRYYRKYFPAFARRADMLATVSSFCRQDIAQTYHIPEKKIKVAGNAAAEDFFPIPADEAEKVRQQWTGGKPYFVFIGTANPRKNIPNQLKAYDAFRAEGNDAALVFAGSRKYWSRKMEQCLESLRFRKEIVFTGYIPTAELNRILSAAVGLLYVSSFEGFGVPILEAFATHTPVITADTTAMPEVAGDAALLVNPQKVEEITLAMEVIFREPEKAESLIAKGRERLPLFSWEQSARQLWEMICSVQHAEKQIQ